MDKKFSYKKSGVDIDKAENFIKDIKPFIESGNTSCVLGSYGGYGGLFDIAKTDVKEPVLVSSTDGVGTKLFLAKFQKKYDTIGIDLTAMCVNDIITSGAKPLFFLDYFSVGRLNNYKGCQIIKGISEGCKQADCVLIGGETAEMPDLYKEGDFDLAGFCVGIVDKNKIIDGKNVKESDAIIGIQSSGVHSNGFSLIRSLYSYEELEGQIGGELLTPTFIYVKAVLKLIEKINVKAIAHITGGGIIGNLPRVLPEGIEAVIKKDSWEIPNLFKDIKKRANMSYKEMHRVFNMGIGMVLVVPKENVEDAKGILKNFYGFKSYDIGYISKGPGKVVFK